METKICTYTEKNVRLQLLRVDEFNQLPLLEVRFNRKLVRAYSVTQALEARLFFSHCVHKIIIDRQMSDLTS